MNRFLIHLAKVPKFQPRFYFAEILKDKDKGDERQYFTKEDQKLMQKLLKKMKETEKPKSGNDKNDKEELQNILSRYRVTHNDALVEEILKWKKDD